MNQFVIAAYIRARSFVNSLVSGIHPPRQIPPELLKDYTIDGEVPVLRWYINDTVSKSLTWTTRDRAWDLESVGKNVERYYGQTDQWLYAALQQYDIRGKSVVIVGSESPWYECICTHFGAIVSTIEYRKIDCQIPGLTVMTPDQYQAKPVKFDVVVSISSIEHDGLGRYGDPINPNGDLEAMSHFKDLLNPGGTLFLAVPRGRDAVVWNAHRIYGPQRFALLTSQWDVIDSFGYTSEVDNLPLGKWEVQPVWLLKPKV